MGSTLDIAAYRHGQVVVVHPRGLLTVRTGTELRRVLTKELTGHGRVVVDLDDFSVGRASCVTIFPAVLTQCSGWPAAKLALCRPEPGMAQALAARRVGIGTGVSLPSRGTGRDRLAASGGAGTGAATF